MSETKRKTIAGKPNKPRLNTEKHNRPDHGGLSREQILTKTLELIDENGLHNFSIRHLASSLGVYHRAIYWHFPSGRSEILGGIATIAFQDVLPREHDTCDWQNWIRELFHRYRKALRKHPNVSPLVGAQMVSNSGVDPLLVESILEALSQAGFRESLLIDAYNSVVAAMLGYVTLELSPPPQDDNIWSEAFAGQISAIPPSRYPLVTHHLEQMVNKSFILRWKSGIEAPLSSGFCAYVDIFIHGLECIAAARDSRRSMCRPGE